MVAYAGGGLELFTQDSVSAQWQRFRLTDDDLLQGWHPVSSYTTRIQVRDARGGPAVGAAGARRPPAPGGGSGPPPPRPRPRCAAGG